MTLSHYSDVLYLEYSKLALEARVYDRDLRHILFHNVENQSTWAIILTIFDKLGSLRTPKKPKNAKPQLVLDRWPGTVFDASSSSRKALQATPLGATVAWLLIQHKTTFRDRLVTEVSVVLLWQPRFNARRSVYHP